jgi:hypothetical protein
VTIKVIQLADDGTEVAAIELDDFTVEVVYSGLADMLHEAAVAPGAGTAGPFELAEPIDLPRDARLRRAKILMRIHD